MSNAIIKYATSYFEHKLKQQTIVVLYFKQYVLAQVSCFRWIRKGSKTYCKLMFYELSSDILVEYVWAT